MSEIVRAIRGVAWLCRIHRCALGLLLAMCIALWVARVEGVAYQILGTLLSVMLILMTWALLGPHTYERFINGPARRRDWRRKARKTWPALCEQAGLGAVVRAPERTRFGNKTGRETKKISIPKLSRVSSSGELLTLTITSRLGQHPDEIVAQLPRITSGLGAVGYYVAQETPSTLVLDLLMRETLKEPLPSMSTPRLGNEVEFVTLGMTERLKPWRLQINERHTLVAGCSGSGKGSVLWGICIGLAPAAAVDTVRLYGVDLKAGLEIAMGRGMFTSTAYTHADALNIMRHLVGIIQERGALMRGVSRKHEPLPGDPTHVLIIDELAALIAYENDPKARGEANRLLSLILTEGRALGVVVAAFVQDPSKETIRTRNLFTQTVALRLRTSDETRMVLGDGMAAVAPAHRISPACPGIAWVTTDTGSAERVRSEYWSDDVIRECAARFPAAVVQPLPSEGPLEAAIPSSAKPQPARSPRRKRATTDPAA